MSSYQTPPMATAEQVAQWAEMRLRGETEPEQVRALEKALQLSKNLQVIANQQRRNRARREERKEK